MNSNKNSKFRAYLAGFFDTKKLIKKYKQQLK